MIGVMGWLATSSLQGFAPPAPIGNLIDLLGLSAWPVEQGVGLAAVVGAALILSKSVIASYLTLRTYRFLFTRQA